MTRGGVTRGRGALAAGGPQQQQGVRLPPEGHNNNRGRISRLVLERLEELDVPVLAPADHALGVARLHLVDALAHAL